MFATIYFISAFTLIWMLIYKGGWGHGLADTITQYNTIRLNKGHSRVGFITVTLFETLAFFTVMVISFTPILNTVVLFVKLSRCFKK